MPKKTSPGKGGGNNTGGEGDSGTTTQTIRGSRHYDEYALPGSRLDYDVTTDGNGNWTITDLNPDDGDLGTLNFTKWEGFQFDDEFVNIWNQHAAEIDGPDTFRITLGESVEFTVTGSDMDGLRGDINYNFTNSATMFGTLTRTETETWTVGGGPGEATSATFVYDSRQIVFFREDYVNALAKGEISEQPQVFSIGNRYHTVMIEVVGVNDAPELAEVYWDLSATHGAEAGRLNLAPAGSDIDSDDTGETLTYEIVNATDDFDVTIEGTELVLRGTEAQAILDSDEFVTGTVDVRARDSHGALSPTTITIDLTVAGSGQPITPVMAPDGTIDFAALGVNLGSGPVYGVLDGYSDDPLLPTLLPTGDIDEIWQLAAARIGNFVGSESYYDLYEQLHGELVNYDSLPIDFGQGNDVAVLNLSGEDLATLEAVDVWTDGGDDIIVATFDTPGVAFAQASFATGMGSDQVYIRMNGGRENLWAGSVNTGSGHDYVDVRLTDSDPGTSVDGFASVNGGFSLGSGNDHLWIEVIGERALSSASVALDIFAGAGDDFVYFSNADVTLREDAIGYKGGFSGEIQLGLGADELILNLSEAHGWSHELEIHGGMDFDTEVDTVVLSHLTQGDGFTVEYTGTSGVAIQHHNQLIEIYRVEQIVLGDGTDVFTLI